MLWVDADDESKWDRCNIAPCSRVALSPTNLAPCTPLQPLEIALRSYLEGIAGWTSLGRQLFPRAQDRQTEDLGDLQDVWYGYKQVRPSCSSCCCGCLCACDVVANERHFFV